MPTKATNMGWDTIVLLIAQVGIPAAEYIWQRWSSGAVPTQADWDTLKAMGDTTPEDLVLKAAAMKGLDPSNPKVVELLALVAAPKP